MRLHGHTSRPEKLPHRRLERLNPLVRSPLRRQDELAQERGDWPQQRATLAVPLSALADLESAPGGELSNALLAVSASWADPQSGGVVSCGDGREVPPWRQEDPLLGRLRGGRGRTGRRAVGSERCTDVYGLDAFHAMRGLAGGHKLKL